MNNTTLLPPSATDQERALDEATARLGDVPVRVRETWNPDTCPAALLPWLAWAFSVDEWNSAWTETQKREAIKASAYIHRHKGTAGAMRRAVDALGYDLDLKEWHQLEPKGDPYTFGLEVTITQTGLPTLQQWTRIEQVALAAKNERSQLTGINMRGISTGTVFLAAAAIFGEVVTVYPEPSIIVLNETSVCI